MKPKKNPKADLSKRKLLFLQFGLILVLLISYLIIEWKTTETEDTPSQQLVMGDYEDEIIPITILPAPTPPPPPPPVDIIEIIDDDVKKDEDEFESTESTQEDIIKIEDIKEVKPDEPIEVPFHFIEDVPIFPGCEGLISNEERKTCMSEKITAYVNRHFNKDIGSQLGLSGITRINLIFKIDKNGNVTGVQSRAPHPKLEEEAARVIRTLPRMKPGKQGGKAVTVSYALPIIFQVQN